MKERLLKHAVLAAAAGILASCASYEEIPGIDEVMERQEEQQLIEMTFTADFEQDEETRTSLETSKWKVKWEKDDKIAVYARGTKSSKADKYTGPVEFKINNATISDNGYTAEFTGNITSDNGYSIADYYAVYPYSSQASISSGTISTTLTSEQAATASSFANNVNIAAAKSQDKNSFQFKNLCALLSFKVNTNIVSATLTSNSGTGMSGGTAKISFSNGTPSMAVSDASASVKLTGTISKDKQYYFVVYPGKYSKGFTIEFEDKDGKVATMSSTKDLTLKARDNVFLGSITVPSEKWSKFNKLTEAGIYSEYTAKYTYTKYSDQLIWTEAAGKNGFRIQSMDSRRYINISGLPAPDKYTVGASFNITVNENILNNDDSAFDDTVTVFSVDESIVRLTGTKYNYIIKITK